VLARRRPDLVTEVVAGDRERGWMLMRDAGPSLHDLDLSPDVGVRHWSRVLPAYAQLQIDVAAAAPELAALVPLDRRTHVLPARFERVLADRDLLLVGEEDGLAAGELARLEALVPTVEAACAALASAAVPDSIQNDDFTTGSVFPSTDGYRFLDWGDACVTHPFFTLTVTMRVIAHAYDLPVGAPELARLRDAYLEPWTRFASRDELTALAALAVQPGQVCRVLDWWHARRSGAVDPAEERDALPWALRLVIEPEAWRDAG
jgi:hypothetical protein